MSFAALVVALALPLTAAHAADDASDFGDDIKTFFSGAADDVAEAADAAADDAKDTFAFFRDEAEGGIENADDDLGFKAPWAK